MQKWPYVDIAYLNVGHVRSMFVKKNSTPKWEYLTVEARFIPHSENALIFFDHYAKEYKGQRSELDAYLAKLSAEGWKLTIATSNDEYGGKAYMFRRSVG